MIRVKRTHHWGFVFVLLLSGGSLVCEPSPEEALAEIRSAVADGNRLLFEKHVDLDRILEDLGPALIGNAEIDIDGGVRSALGLRYFDLTDRLDPIQQARHGVTLDSINSAYRAALRAEILQAVDEGILLGREDSDPAFGSSLLNAMWATGIAPGYAEGVERVIEEGVNAIATVRFMPEVLDSSIELQLRMVREDGLWRVVQVQEPQRLVDSIEALQMEHRERVQAEDRAAIWSVLSEGDISIEPGYLPGGQIVTQELTNTSDIPVAMSHFTLWSIQGPHGPGHPYLYLIPPGATRTVSVELSPWFRVDDSAFLFSEYNVLIGEGDELESRGLGLPSWGGVLFREIDPEGWLQSRAESANSFFPPPS